MPKHDDVLTEALKAIEDALKLQWTWKRQELPEGAVGYVGTADGGWNATVARFSIENQGFPAGSVGYDGALANLGRRLMTRLPRDVAEKFWLMADGG